jgi:tellurite resistance protein
MPARTEGPGFGPGLRLEGAMTQGTDLGKAAASLEETFFAGENANVLAELRRTTDERERRAMLREVVKLKDERFLNRIVALGVTPQTALVVALAPLVVVAWADGKLDDREREAILKAAQDRGVTSDKFAHRALAGALMRPPDPRLFALWKGYVGRLWGCFTADESWAMRSNVLKSVREVAESAGGFLGITSKISAEERRVLEELEKLLD